MQDNSPQPSEQRPEDSSQSQENREEGQLSQTTNREDLPKWLRAELGPPTSEVAQLKEELARNQRELTRMNSRLSSMQEHIVPHERGCWLTMWLVQAGIASILGLIFGFLSISTGGLGFLAISTGGLIGGLGFLAIALIALLGVIGTWQLKKWGYYTLMVWYVFVLALPVFPGTNIEDGIAAAIGNMLFLSLLVLPRWRAFE